MRISDDVLRTLTINVDALEEGPSDGDIVRQIFEDENDRLGLEKKEQ